MNLIIDRDRFLRSDDHSQFDWFGHIDFMLFYKSLDGFPIESHLDNRKIVDEQVVVTLMMANFIEQRDPRTYGQRFYQHIKPFAQALAAKNFYWMPIILADAQILMPDKHEQNAFLNRCAEQFHNESNVLPSLGNECSKNGVDASFFSRPQTNNLWSRGSEVGDEPPYRPGWDWKEWHPRRDWPKVLFGNDDAWFVKEGVDSENNRLDNPMPIVVSEPIGFWDRDVPNRRSSDPNLARVIGGTARYFARGVNFHSEEGLHSEPWTARTKECAVAMAAAMRQV